MNHSSLYHFSFFFLFFFKIILDNFTCMISMVWQSIWKDQPKLTLQSPQHKVAGIQEVKRHTCEANRPFHVHVLDHCFMTYMANEVSRKKSRFCSGNPLSISGDTRHNVSTSARTHGLLCQWRHVILQSSKTVVALMLFSCWDSKEENFAVERKKVCKAECVEVHKSTSVWNKYSKSYSFSILIRGQHPNIY